MIFNRRIVKGLLYYQSLNYEMHLKYDRDDKAWFVEFPELPGCIADGETIGKAIKRALKTKDDWLKIAMESGWKMPEPS
jgi:predicted RNase H-like HicB family nuclease